MELREEKALHEGQKARDLPKRCKLPQGIRKTAFFGQSKRIPLNVVFKLACLAS